MEKGILDFKSVFSKLSGKKVSTILLIVGFAGIALIFLSDFFHPFDSSQGAQSSSSSLNNSSDSSINTYEAQTEKKLESIIGSINGVGRVKVMVTVESGVENVYETDNKESTDKSEGGGSSESSHVIINNNSSGEEALLKTQLKPDILGVVVVCDGGSNSDVQESVVNTVSTALGLPTNHITVNRMQQKS